MGQQYDGYFRPKEERQREYNMGSIDILRRMINKEISPDQAKVEQAQLTEQYPEFKSAPPEEPLSPEQYEEKMNALYAEPTNVQEEIGYRQAAKAGEIPAAAKAAMHHRIACGVKLSDNDLARFWDKIEVGKKNDCWPWKKSTRGSLGYGQFRIGNKICDAHRISLELGHGPLKKGRYVCHSCDNPLCCNPHHLFGGTQKENMDDMSQKGRWRNQT